MHVLKLNLAHSQGTWLKGLILLSNNWKILLTIVWYKLVLIVVQDLKGSALCVKCRTSHWLQWTLDEAWIGFFVSICFLHHPFFSQLLQISNNFYATIINSFLLLLYPTPKCNFSTFQAVAQIIAAPTYCFLCEN